MRSGRPENVKRRHVVIVGAGFGGVAAARGLARSPVDITLVDRRNYHLFQPLLYQVATAGLSPADIAWPIRAIFSGQDNVQVQMGRVTGVDAARCEVMIEDRRLAYDYLVLATGARHAYFGNDAWEAAAPGLKKIADATAIRERVLIAFERAELEDDPRRRQRLLTFVVIGAGPTGVEMAGAIAELARHALAGNFRRIDPCQARVLLVEGGPRVLPAFPACLSAKAEAALANLGVEVRKGVPVTACDVDGVTVGDERIEAATLVWAAGVMASPAAKWLGTRADGAGRVQVARDLSVPGCPGVFAIGDTALVTGPDGRPVPGIAPAAKQMGAFVARLIDAELSGMNRPAAFAYRHAGSLATIGRKAAVGDFGWLRLSGFPAWLLWATAHVYFLIGWRSRLSVSLQWGWSYLTYSRGARLITGASAARPGSIAAGPASEARAARQPTRNTSPLPASR
jgi:NADH dehydrogenase